MAAAQLGYRCHIFDPARSALRGRGRGRVHPRRLRRPRGARRLRRRRRRRHLRVRESAGRAARACSATSCIPAPRSLAIAQDRADEKALHRRHRRPRRAVARGRQPRRRRRGRRRARRCRSCSRPAATAMTARARPGSARPTKREAAWDAIGGEPAVAEAGVDFRRRILGHRRALGGRPHTPSGTARDNVHRDGILRTLDRPCRRPRSPRRSRKRATPRPRIAEALGHVGVLTVEFFASRRRPGRQRDRAARPQQRPLDDRGRRHLAVRAAHPRHLRPAARLDRARRRRRRRWTI